MRRISLFLALSTVSAMAAESMEAVAAKVGKLLSGIPGVQTMAVGDSVVVSGELESHVQMVKLINVVDGLKSVVIHNVTSLSPKAREAMAEAVTSEIGTVGVRAKLVNNLLVLEGQTKNDYEADRAVEIAKSFVLGPASKVAEAPEIDRLPQSQARAGAAEAMPTMHNRNGLPTTVVDLLRVSPRPSKGPATK